ncbi:MAG: twin-arginine translocase TatA/TatE family subunit [Thermoproteota archaeon]
MLDAIPNLIAGQEWIFIIIIAVIVIFGAKKIPELAKTFGKAKSEYEKGKIEGDKELKEFKDKKDS